jgi:hypothetical protein
MRIPKSYIKNNIFEIGKTVIVKPRKKAMEFYHKRISWWITIYGVRFRRVGYYVMLKKICF